MSGWTAINRTTSVHYASIFDAAFGDSIEIESSSNEYEDDDRMAVDANVESLDLGFFHEPESRKNIPNIIAAPAPASVPSASAAAFATTAAAANTIPLDLSASSQLDFTSYFTVGELNLQTIHEGKKGAKFGHGQRKIIIQWMVESERYKICYQAKQDKIAFEIDLAGLIELLEFENPNFPDTLQHKLIQLVKSEICGLWQEMKKIDALLPVYFLNGARIRGRYTWAEFTQEWTEENWDGNMV